MREICKSGSEGGAGQTNVPFLPLFKMREGRALACGKLGSHRQPLVRTHIYEINQ